MVYLYRYIALLWRIIEMTQQCNRCDWTWEPTAQNPKKCPKCGSPYWNKPRVMKDFPLDRRAKKNHNNL